DKANCPKPEKARPTKQKITQTDRRDDKRDLKLGPNCISKPDQIRTPLLHRRRLPLIKPSQMSPPESAVAGTGDILDRISLRMVISMVRDPCVWRPRSIEHGSADEHLLDNR